MTVMWFVFVGAILLGLLAMALEQLEDLNVDLS